MKEYINILKETNLFSGIAQDEIISMCNCLNCKCRSYQKSEKIIWEGDVINNIGIILSGSARSIKTEVSGKIIIVTIIKTGSYTGVLLAASRNRKSPVTVEAEEQVKLLTIPIDKIMTHCKQYCSNHNLLLRNYLDIVAEKSMVLHDRIDCLIRHSVREKILAYLLRISKEIGSNSFTIPLDRHAMGEYLNVERSALSRELSRMKTDGLIDYQKNKFSLL